MKETHIISLELHTEKEWYVTDLYLIEPINFKAIYKYLKQQILDYKNKNQ